MPFSGLKSWDPLVDRRLGWAQAGTDNRGKWK